MPIFRTPDEVAEAAAIHADREVLEAADEVEARLDVGGEVLSADSIRSRLSREVQEQIDAKMASWFSRETELGAYTSEQALELSRHVI